MTTPLRIGFVGLGAIGRIRHVPGFRALPNVEIAVVANRTEVSTRAAAEELGIPETAASWTEIVARDDIDAVVIGTWPYMHHPISIAALAAGKHVFCQARMAMNYREACEMKAAADQSGKVAMLCPVPIGLSIDATIARFLRDGMLGAPRLVRVQGLYNTFAKPEALMGWRKDHRFSGLNALTLGMYVEVIHRWFGPTAHVAAFTSTFVNRRIDTAGLATAVQIPDQMLINTRLKSGLDVQYTFSGAVADGRDRIEIHGTEAAIVYDVTDDALFYLTDGRTAVPVQARPEERYDVNNWDVEARFVRAIRDGVPARPDFTDGCRYMQVVQAVYDSAEAERTVHLNLH
jgi:predicted dehydrogenase